MKKIYSIFASALLLLFALQGCNKTYMKAIVPEQKPGEEEPVIEDDDISKLLKSIEGVQNVEISVVDAVKQYFFTYQQLIDHNAPEKGTFYQRVAIQLTDLNNPVLVNTQGYKMEMDGMHIINRDLITLLNANWVEIEFRYFGESQPEGLNNVEFTYLYSEQSAEDIHAIVAVLKANLFKQNKWIATGASKGGTTATLHAYFADQKGWKDFDLYVPFCAPFLAGTETSPLDANIGKYTFFNCGAGYQAGSQEAKAYANLQKILLQCVSKPTLRNAVLCRYHSADAAGYRIIANQLKGATEERMLAGFYVSYLFTLQERFAYYPFSQWASLVPDPDLVQADEVVNFLYMSEDEFKEKIRAAETKSIHTAEEMLAIRMRPNSDLAYRVAAIRELGCVGVDFSWLPEGGFLTPEVGYAVEDLAVGSARTFDYYEGQWDGGKLMTALREWVWNSKQKIVFVYGSNDPWTGGAIDDAAAEANPNVVKVMNLGGIHTDAVLHEDYFTKEARTQIQNAVKDFLSK